MKRTKSTYRGLRVAALLLLLAIVIGVLPKPAMAGNGLVTAGGSNANFTTMTFVKWHRMIAKNGYNPYPPYLKGTYPVLVMWKTDGTYYVADGGLTRRYYTGWWGDWWRAAGSVRWEDEGRKGYVPRPNDTEDSWNVDTFYTKGSPSSWKVEFTGRRDGDNGAYPIVYFWMNEKEMLDAESHWHTAGAGTTGNKVENTIQLGPVPRFKWEYLFDPLMIVLLADIIDWSTPRNYVEIYHNEKAATDTWFSYYSDRVWGDKSYFSLSNTSFNLYWGEEATFTALDNTVVPKGSVLNIDDGVILKDGCKLYISPGATVVVEGQFFNNGTIENHGTLVLKEGACISSFMPQSEESGSIICDGSQVNEAEIMQDAIDQNDSEIISYSLGLTAANVDRIAASDALEAAKDAKRQYEDENPQDMEKILTAQRSMEEARDKVDTIDADIAALKEEQTEHETDVKDLQQQLDDERKDLTEAQIAKRENEITKIKNRIEEIKKKVAALEADRVKADADYKTASEDYYKVAEKYEALDQAIGDAEEVLADRDAAVEKAQLRVDALERNGQELREMLQRMQAQGIDPVRAGEGNMILLHGAKLFQNTGSKLTVKNGGSIVCSGLIFSPCVENPIVVSNAKLEIRRDGVLLTGYQMTRNLNNLHAMKIRNPDSITTLTVGDNYYVDGSNSLFWVTEEKESMAPVSGSASSPLLADGSYFVEIDGFWKESSRTKLSVSPSVSEGQAYVANSKTWVLTGNS